MSQHYYQPQYPYPPRRPRKNHTVAAVIVSVIAVVALFFVVMFFGLLLLIGAASGSSTASGGPTKLPSPGMTSSTPGDDATDMFNDDGGSRAPVSDKPIGSCDDTEGYKNYAQVVNETYDRYKRQLDNGTIIEDNGLKRTEDDWNYVHDYMIVLTDYHASLYFGCATQSTSVDEVNDQYDAKAQEVRDYEAKFKAHKDLGVTVKITGRDGQTYESDGKAPEKTDVTELENRIKAVPMKPGADGTWIDTGDALVKAAGLTANYDYAQIGQYCRRSFGDTKTVEAAFCSASPTVVYVNENHPNFNRSITSSYYADVIKHELAHALINMQCGTTDPAVGADGEGLANSYAVKYLAADRTNLQDNVQDYPEYAITAATDRGADMVHAGQCTAS